MTARIALRLDETTTLADLQELTSRAARLGAEAGTPARLDDGVLSLPVAVTVRREPAVKLPRSRGK